MKPFLINKRKHKDLLQKKRNQTYEIKDIEKKI